MRCRTTCIGAGDGRTGDIEVLKKLGTNELADYAKELLDGLNSMLDLKVSLKFDSSNSGLRSYLEKNVVGIVNESTMLHEIRGGIIGLNLTKLTTYSGIRRALAHEFAHLYPGTSPFESRWKLWERIVSQVDRMIQKGGV